MTKSKKPSPNKCRRNKPKATKRRSTGKLKQLSYEPVSVWTTLEEIILKKLEAAQAAGVPEKAITQVPLAWGRTEPALLAAGPGVEPWWQQSVRKPSKSVQDLVSLLLQFGGNKACVPFEEVPLCEAYATLGRLVVPETVLIKHGEVCGCHSNSLTEWLENLELSFVTGFGLTDDDGMWRAHSWLVDQSGQVIETTEPRSKYFGVQLDVPDLLEFCKARMEARGWEVTTA